MLLESSSITLYALGKENICFYLLLGCHIAICSQGALCQEVSQSVQVIITPMNIMSIRYIIPFSYHISLTSLQCPLALD